MKINGWKIIGPLAIFFLSDLNVYSGQDGQIIKPLMVLKIYYGHLFLPSS